MFLTFASVIETHSLVETLILYVNSIKVFFLIIENLFYCFGVII